MITKMHISRASPRRKHQHQHPTSSSSHTRRKRTVRVSTSCAASCDLCLSLFVRLPILQTDGVGGARQVDCRPAHARASSVPDHAQGTVVLPLGAQTGCSSSSIANSNYPTHHPQQQRWPASAQHISSHAHAYIVPSLSRAALRLSSFTAACLFPQITATAMRHVQAIADSQPKGPGGHPLLVLL